MTTTLLYALGVLIFIVALAISIGLHELGHLVPAKRFGVKVTQYMIGFGPTIFSWRRGETEYGVKWIPLGGYIRMIGMFPPRPGEDDRHLRDSSTGAFQTLAEDARRASAEEVAPGDENRVFYKLSAPRKIIVMMAGPVMNLVLAFVLFAVLLVGLGDPRSPQTTTTIDTVSVCMVRPGEPAPQTCPDDQRTPAVQAGLQPRDRVVSIDGVAITDWETERTLIRDLAGQTVPIVVERDGRQLELTITPISNQVYQLDADGEVVLDAQGQPRTTEAGFVGITPRQVTVPTSITAVPGFTWDQFTGSLNALAHLPVRLVDVAKAAFGTQERDPTGPIGIVGVGRLTGEAVSLDSIELRDKTSFVIGMLGSLNMFLFVLNLVPLLPLDGGHVAGAIWEGLRRQLAKLIRRPDPGPVDVSKLLPVVYVVSVVLIGMSVLLLYADIVRPITLRG